MRIADASYVLLTSYKRDGSGVGTPVWIAPLDDGRAGVTTSARAWKVRRIRRDPRVTLQACDRRGRPLPGSTPVEVRGAVHEDASAKDAVARALTRKYGVQYRAFQAIERIVGAVRRRPMEGVVILLEPAPAP